MQTDPKDYQSAYKLMSPAIPLTVPYYRADGHRIGSYMTRRLVTWNQLHLIGLNKANVKKPCYSPEAGLNL